ncbi:hypothetical protein NXS19_010614 [Fusarium pseudograminearum]|nr:hypothetical protein NXS19_010614 [Fusarium pseudograminearum]
MRNDTPNIIASAAITLPLATLALIARLVARRITKAGYGIDDAFSVVGWLGSLALLTNGMIWIKDGLGKPMENGLTDDFTFYDKNRLAWIHMWTTSFTYTFAIAFSKFAILAFYWRLFQFSDIRIPIQVLSCITVAWFLLRLLMVAVIALFAFGAMTCLASIFVLIESFKFESDSKEMTLQMGQHYAWSIAECNFAVIAACLPMLRPVARRVLPGSFLTSNSGGRSTQFSAPFSAPFSNGIRLEGVSKTKSRENDGASSTRELASSSSQPDIYDMAEWPQGGTQTTISSPFRKYASAKDYEGSETGIRVDLETDVSVRQGDDKV